MLQQKYELFYCDNGNEEILFYCCQDSLLVVPDFTITPTAGYTKFLTKLKNRYFVWRDELGATHSQGTATDPLHNLGFLPSTASPPSRTSNASIFQAITRPDFRVQDGDIFEINAMGVTQRGFALVTEQYIAPDHIHKQPRWEMIIDANPVFDNTAGGALPSTIERVSNYTPLNTSMFSGILGASDNNLQAAMDRLDDHIHTGGLGALPYALPIATPADSASGATLRLAANGGSFAIPFYLPAPMNLASVTIRNTDTATARTWGWDLYYEATSSNVLTRAAQCFADQTFTPTAAAWRTIVASGGPITLAPGLYWLVVQCRHATNDFGFGTIAGQSTNLTQTKTTTNPNGATLDFTAATWTKQTSLACARLNGAVFAQATAF